MPADSEPIDFTAAETFLAVARKAHERQDWIEFVAARKMVALSLGLQDVVPDTLMAARLKRR